jgi:AcrR family transcriptional regulator
MAMPRVSFGAGSEPAVPSRSGRAAGQPCGPHRKRGAALEDAILSASFEELTEVGYTSFSIEGVAARARTGKASIYRRWPTKHKLLLDTLEAYLPTPQQCGVGNPIPDGVTTVEALRTVARIITDVLNSPAGDAMRAIKCEAAVDVDLARAVDDIFQAPRRAALLELLERGVERGEVRPDAVTPLVADVLPAVLFHQIVLRREPVTEHDVRQIIDQVLIPLVEAR